MDSNILFSIVILVVSVVIHEVSHGYMAYFLGDPTAKLAGRLTLNPLKHADLFGSFLVPLVLSLFPGGFIIGWAKPVPYNPYNLKAGKWGPALVAAAGPGSNFVLAIIFAIFFRLLVVNPSFAPILPLLLMVIFTNVILGLFNLTPVAPFDGSKILFTLLSTKWRKVEVYFSRNHWWLVIIVILAMSSVLSPVASIITRVLTGA
jgi:Zn-dependent protease